MADSADDDDDDDATGRSASADELDVAELSRSYCLPSHILHLRQAADCDITGHLPRGGSVTVHSISTVLRGSQFGPFNCHIVDRAQTSSADSDCVDSDQCHLEASSARNTYNQSINQSTM